MTGAGIRIVLCLGNPGSRYTLTWHNAGFWTGDILAREAGVAFKNAGLFQAAVLPGGIHLVKPVTYMNRSGRVAGALLKPQGLEPREMLVVCDDANLPLGVLRIRGEGSAGGQKGLQSIIDVLDTTDFPRLRMGIGPVPPGIPLSDFVLSRVPKSLEEEASVMAHRAADCVWTAIESGIPQAQSIFNGQEGGRPDEPPPSGKNP